MNIYNEPYLYGHFDITTFSEQDPCDVPYFSVNMVEVSVQYRTHFWKKNTNTIVVFEQMYG